jgi:hypothetical protein
MTGLVQRIFMVDWLFGVALLDKVVNSLTESRKK